jgi:hypothetical protein
MIPGVPSDNTTLVEVLDDLAAQGFDGTMWVTQDGRLRCEGCGAELDPAVVRVHEIRRLVGASDPDDMLAVVAVECPVCSMRGTLVLHYGPEVSPEEITVFEEFNRNP